MSGRRAELKLLLKCPKLGKGAVRIVWPTNRDHYTFQEYIHKF